MSEEDLERDLERLRRAYRGKLTGKLAQLDFLLGEARRLPEREEIEAARDLAHTLKGTSGSYGFDESSAEFKGIEERLDQLLEGASEGAAAAWMEIEQALTRARIACS